ncbi:MAG: thermostable hemolysin [Rhodospirillales bacterium]|nr:thermostable hemolysin [Alphaproteobacteria bacterium]MCB9986380.1 thermostable hemolysin [Rhodospirillales bacterium]USO07071.1 MAG: thermostable hemolysin [Rhodospirillales bacterium]
MLIIPMQEHESAPAQLCLDARLAGRLAALNPSVIDICSRFAPARKAVEGFIADVYKRTYGADIAVTYPTLMSVRDANGYILAACGFRMAETEPLFLERYTGAPVESLLEARIGHAVARGEVAEIGNLASGGQGASLFLFAALSMFLNARGVRHAVITGTDVLTRRLHKMGLQPAVLCEADPSALEAEERRKWGSYYETSPRVLAGTLDESVRHLQDALGMSYKDASQTLYTRLHHRVQA